MKLKRMITWILVLALLMPCLTLAGHAAGNPDFSVTVTPATTVIGGQAEVTVSLEGYDSASIQGLQVEINGIDTDVLEVVDYRSAIAESGLLSNQASYNADRERVTLLYFRESGALPAPCEDVLKMTVRIDPELTEEGSIRLPVTVKSVTTEGLQETQEAVCTIRYVPVAENAVAWNADTCAFSETVSDALNTAKAGERVMVLADCAESLVLVPAGVTLDLNGHVLTASNVVSFGAVIDTSNTVGGIRIDIDTTKAFTKLQPENAGYLPVYDTEDGMYRFFRYTLKTAGAKASGNAVKFGVQLLFDNAQAYDILANTGNSGVKLVAKLNWSGMPYSIAYEIAVASVSEYCRMKAENPAKNYAITLNISGLDSIPGDAPFISVAPIISTIAEVGTEINALVYKVG